MKVRPGSPEPRAREPGSRKPGSSQEAEAIRAACVAAAIEGYEDALVSGLCREGAWEAAIGAMRRLDPSQPDHDEPRRPGPGVLHADAGDVEAAASSLARRFPDPAGPGPAAGSAVAVTGAIAAGLVAWTAGRSEERGEPGFRHRAHKIRRRAETIREALAVAAERDAETARALIESATEQNARESAASSLGIATRCAQVVTLAAELGPQALHRCRPDVEVALRLAASSAECALELVGANLQQLEESSGWVRDAGRRAWRVRLLLGRSVPDES